MNDFIPALKDRVIFLGWVTALILALTLLWSLSFPIRAAFLMRSTNRVLASMEDGKRLSAPLIRPFPGPVPLGCWYTLAESDSLFFVFTIMRDGILVPCGAEISGGLVTGIIPLGGHARQVFDRIPREIIQIYSRRIESVVAGKGKK